MKLTETKIGSILEADNLNLIPGVSHGFGFRGISLQSYLDVLNIKDRYIMDTKQIHGNDVHCLMYPKKGEILKGDAFVTDRPGIVCYIKTADCAPILICDPVKGAVGAIHVGWRSAAKDIIQTTIQTMKMIYKTNPNDLIVAIGPSICGKCYQVGNDVIDSFRKLEIGDDWLSENDKVDLKLVAKLLLMKHGVLENNIEVGSICTHEEDMLSSFRRDNDDQERQVSFILVT